jgi:translation initiation factor IF-2
LPLSAPSLVEGLSEIPELRLAFTTCAADPWQALSTNNIDMSSTESSGAPAEGSATPPAPAAEFPTFGTTRGSGLARGKRSSAGPATNAAPAPSDYKPTAIEVINAPREYQNPFAPATPEPVQEQPAQPARPEYVEPSAPAQTPVAATEPAASSTEAETAEADGPAETPAQLNILEPERQRSVPPQTWESEGFRPAREARHETSRHESSRYEAARQEEPAEEVDIASIPPQFLYVRPGVKFVPTPKNWGGAPRERAPRLTSAGAPAAAAAAARETAKPAASGGIFGWIKSLFGGSSAPAAPVESPASEHFHGGNRRGDRGRSPGGEGGYRRRHRGGRGRSRGGRDGGHGST